MKKFSCLWLKARFVEIEQTFDRIGPGQSVFSRQEKWVRAPHEMHDDRGWFIALVRLRQRWVKLFDEVQVRHFPGQWNEMSRRGLPRMSS